jgi:hypothetical protein
MKAGPGQSDLRAKGSGDVVSDVAPRGGTQVWNEQSAPRMPAGWASTGGARAVSGPEAFDVAPPSSFSSAFTLAEGTRLGQYEIIRELGRGGMGVVFLARDDKLGRRVALKLLQSSHPELTRRFIIEARATARCNHENIVVIHEVGEHQGNPFMVLEYLQGQPLSSIAGNGKTLQPSRAVEIMVPVARALAYAHGEGIVHRDLKLENVFVTEFGSIKVLDFGIAKLREVEAQGTESRSDLARARDIALQNQDDRTGLVGTIAYMSPQQWGAGGDIDHRTDIWAAGIMLFQLLTGQHPLANLAPSPITYANEVQNLDKPMPRLGDVAPEVPRELAALVDACLEKHLERRVPDAAALLRGLEPFMPGRFTPAGAPIEAGPYAGLRAFQEDDAGRFFGRAGEIRAMVTRIRNVPLIATVGPSGIGKSSLVRAGVVPALKSSGEEWDVLVVRPGRDPVLGLANLIAPLLGGTGSVADDLSAQNDVRRLLLEEPGSLGRVLRSACRRPGQHLLLFVDQFEELYTHGAHPLARRAFTDCLSGAADDATSPVRVIVSIRSDFLGRVAEDPQFMNELGKALFFVGPPSAEGLRDALVQPAELAGYRFETQAMVDDMLRHLEATPGGLPLLQFTAAQLWEMRDPARRLLTEQSYQRLGGIAGALVSHADRVIDQLTPDLQALCRSLFVHLVTPERTRAVRHLEELRELAGQDGTSLERLVDHLVDARLLVVQQASTGGATVEIVHESLIVSWPKLRRWLEETHEDSVFLEQLLAAARQWRATRHDSGLLGSGEMVEELRRFQRRYHGELPDIGKRFTKAVFDHHDRRRRFRRALTVGGTMFLLALLAAATVGLIVISNAHKAAQEAAAEARTAEAEAQRRLAERVKAEEARERAESERKKAEQERVAALLAEKSAQDQVSLTNEQLAQRNNELRVALAHAEQQRLQAEANERSARIAEDKAKRAEEKALEAEAREKKRANDLEKRLGSPMVEVLR